MLILSSFLILAMSSIIRTFAEKNMYLLASNMLVEPLKDHRSIGPKENINLEPTNKNSGKQF